MSAMKQLVITWLTAARMYQACLTASHFIMRVVHGMVLECLAMTCPYTYQVAVCIKMLCDSHSVIVATFTVHYGLMVSSAVILLHGACVFHIVRSL